MLSSFFVFLITILIYFNILKCNTIKNSVNFCSYPRFCNTLNTNKKAHGNP